MKILIAAAITDEPARRSFIAQMISICAKAGITCALSCPDHGEDHAVWYPSPSPRVPYFNFHADSRSYEEYMYTHGWLGRKYTLTDVASLEEAIKDFKPELILSLDRPGALLTAQLHNLPCWVFVHPSIYRGLYFPPHCLYGFNAVCSSLKLEQQLSLPSLYSTAHRRIGFGSEVFAPFLYEENVSRIGFMCSLPHKPSSNERLIICPGTINLSPARLHKIIEAAFLGASYRVDIYGTEENEVNNNLHYHIGFDLNELARASAVIHDGSSPLCSASFAYGLPQIIIADHTCFRSFNALALQRVKAGLVIFEENLSMASLYETYRTLVSDDSYAVNARAVKNTAKKHGSISEIIDLMYIDLINTDEKKTGAVTVE
jgi:hypothetical protein